MELTLDFWRNITTPYLRLFPNGEEDFYYKEGLKAFLHFLSRAGLYLFNNATELK